MTYAKTKLIKPGMIDHNNIILWIILYIQTLKENLRFSFLNLGLLFRILQKTNIFSSSFIIEFF